MILSYSFIGILVKTSFLCGVPSSIFPFAAKALNSFIFKESFAALVWLKISRYATESSFDWVFAQLYTVLGSFKGFITSLSSV